MRTIAITQARTGSTRFPGKVLTKIGDKSLLELHLSRILRAKRIDELILATTTSIGDQAIKTIGTRYGIDTYCGSEDDVLDRFYQALNGKKADYVVRLTSDCPLIDPALIDQVIDHAIERNLDYCSNTLNPTYPDGQDVEVFRWSALEQAWSSAKLASEREHVTPYIWKNSSYKGGTPFISANYEGKGKSFAHLRMTVDERADFELVAKLINELGEDKTWTEYAAYLEDHPSVKMINKEFGRNEGYTKSVDKESKI